MTLDLKKAISLANEHKVYIPASASLIEYRIQLHNLNGWEDHGAPQGGLDGYNVCKKWKQELISQDEIARIVAIVEVS